MTYEAKKFDMQDVKGWALIQALEEQYFWDWVWSGGADREGKCLQSLRSGLEQGVERAQLFGWQLSLVCLQQWMINLTNDQGLGAAAEGDVRAQHARDTLYEAALARYGNRLMRDEVIAKYQAVLDSYLAMDRHKEVAFLTMLLAKNVLHKSEKLARDLYVQAYASFKATGNVSGQIDALRKAVALEQNGIKDFGAAVRLYRQLRALLVSAHCAEAYEDLIQLELTVDDADAADAHCSTLLALRQSTNDYGGQLLAYKVKGDLAQRLGKTAESEAAYQAAIELCGQMGDHRTEGDFLTQRGWETHVLLMAHPYDRVEVDARQEELGQLRKRLYRDARSAYRNGQTHCVGEALMVLQLAEAGALRTLAGISTGQEYAKTNVYLLKALSIYKAYDQKAQQVEMLQMLSDRAEEKSRHKHTIRNNELILQLQQDLDAEESAVALKEGRPAELASYVTENALRTLNDALTKLVDIELARNNHSAVYLLFQKQLAMLKAQEPDDTYSKHAELLQKMGDAQLRLGDFSLARFHYEEVWALCRPGHAVEADVLAPSEQDENGRYSKDSLLGTCKPKPLAEVIKRLGVVAARRKDYDNARRYFAAEVMLYEKGDWDAVVVNFSLAEAYLNLAVLEAEQGFKDATHQYCEKSLEPLRYGRFKVYRTEHLITVARVMISIENFDAAEGYLRSADALAILLHQPKVQGFAQSFLGDVKVRLGQKAEAKVCYLKAAEHFKYMGCTAEFNQMEALAAQCV